MSKFYACLEEIINTKAPIYSKDSCIFEVESCDKIEMNSLILAMCGYPRQMYQERLKFYSVRSF